jgi:hypothetical protein
MAWQYDIEVEGVKVDIEYSTDRDIETGEWFNEVEQVQIGGVNAAPLLYAINQDAAKKLIEQALADAIKADERDATRARRIKQLDRAMCGDVMSALAKLKVAA